MLNKIWKVKGNEINTVAEVKDAIYGIILENKFGSSVYDKELITGYKFSYSDEEIFNKLNDLKLNYKIFALKEIKRPAIFTEEIDNIINDIVIENKDELEEYSITETNMDNLLKKLKEKLDIKLKE